MDDYIRRRSAGGFGFSRRGSSIALREPNREDRSIQYCNRLGCSTNLNYMKGSHVSNLEKPTCSRSSFRSTCSKALADSSSGPFTLSSAFAKSHHEQKNRIPLQAASIAESGSSSSSNSSSSSSSSSRKGPQDLEQVDIQEQIQESRKPEETEDALGASLTASFQALLGDSDNPGSSGTCSTDMADTLSGCNAVSTSRSHRQISRRQGFSDKDSSSGFVAQHSTISRSTGQTAKPASQVAGVGSQRYGLKNFSCTSISDVLPASNSSDVHRNNRVESVRKRLSERDGAAARGKGIVGSSSGGYSVSQQSSSSGMNHSSSEHLMPQQGSRRGRNRPISREGVVSVRTRRGPTGQTKIRLSEQGDDSMLSLPEPMVIPQLSHTPLHISEDIPESRSRSLPLESPPVIHDSFRRPGSSSRSAHSRLLPHSEDSNGQMPPGPLGGRGAYRRLNMEGIAELLLALERIEHDEELTYEQLFVLEGNLYMGGVSFRDQHRDMRMDIDNMSYEELLALEEKMGTVSTALSEEALSTCLKRSIFMPNSLVPQITACGDDIKCSICQEEYVAWDRVGMLACEHRYHVACIYQWLRLKNWCPICKSSAVPST